MASLHGVGELTATDVVTGLRSRRPLIDRLLKEVTVVHRSKADFDGSPLAGKSVVFTGKLDTLDRRAAQKLANELGGSTPAGVTKDLSYLVVGGDEMEGEATGKRAKAAKYNADGAAIAIISEKEFLALVETARRALKRP